MGIGESAREVHVDADRDAAYAAVAAAAETIGKVIDASPDLGALVVRTRFGLQRVKLRVAVIPADPGSRITISAFADDIWGGGARRGSDKLLRALQEQLAH